MTNKVVLGISIIIITVFTYLALSENTTFYPIKQTEKQTIHINNTALKIEIADEISEQQLGLSGRESLPENSGMLFMFPEGTTDGFWMKNMNFSLDIIWIDAGKKVIGIEKKVSPDTFPTIFLPPLPVHYVLEVNAGWTEKNNIQVGSMITLNLNR